MTTPAKSTRKRFVVAKASELAPGRARLVTAGGRDIALFNVAGAFYALANKCPHVSGPLCRGTIIGLSSADVPGQYRLERPGEFVRCPWHGWEFDVRNGQSWCDPTRVRARRYAVAVEAGTKLVAGPYAAETVPVTVEGDYVVVEA